MELDNNEELHNNLTTTPNYMPEKAAPAAGLHAMLALQDNGCAFFLGCQRIEMTAMVNSLNGL